jgi:hypothetical protein
VSKRKLNNWKTQRYIFNHEKLGPKAKTMSTGLLNYRNVRTGQCNPRLETLAKDLSRGKSYLLDGADELVTAKELAIKTGSQNISNQYFFFHDDAERAEQHWSEYKAAEAAGRIEKRKKCGGNKKLPENSGALASQVEEDKDVVKNDNTQPTEKEEEVPEPAPRKHRPEVDDPDKSSSPRAVPSSAAPGARVCANCQSAGSHKEEGGHPLIYCWCGEEWLSTDWVDAKNCDRYMERKPGQEMAKAEPTKEEIRDYFK